MAKIITRILSYNLELSTVISFCTFYLDKNSKKGISRYSGLEHNAHYLKPKFRLNARIIRSSGFRPCNVEIVIGIYLNRYYA